MKKTLSILLISSFIASLSACSSPDAASNDSKHDSGTEVTSSQAATDQASTHTEPKITSDEALDIALKHAGVAADSIRDLESKLETENGMLVYEIDFDAGNIEYSYEVNAETGAIVEYDRDNDDDTSNATQ